MMLEPNKSGIAILAVQIGPIVRENVGMEIDLQEE